jgi:hypothetical protein
MSVNCDPASLVKAAACYDCIPHRMRSPVMNYLLSLIAGVSADPAALVKASACLSCIPKAMIPQVQTYLMAIAAGSVTGGGGGGGGAIMPPVVVPTQQDVVGNWAAQVVTNGGAAPSSGTKAALQTFVNSLYAANLFAKLVVVNCMVPDNLIACLTPLFNSGLGNNPWTNNNFVAGDLSVNGLQGNGTNKYLNTGIFFNQFASTISDSVALYNTVASVLSCTMSGSASGTGKMRFGFDTPSLGSYFASWTDASSFGDGLKVNARLGYMCGVKSAANVRNLYFANSTTPHASIATGNVNESTVISTVTTYLFCSNEGGSTASFSNQRFSYYSVGLALTAADSLNLYNAVQALRTSLGGGFV